MGQPRSGAAVPASFKMVRQLAFLALVVQLVSGVAYQLSHERRGNAFNLTCRIQDGPSSGSAQLHFWVNQTSLRIDTILSHAERVSPGLVSISFTLEPQYEGTFFCGEVGRGQSNTLGPFAVNPQLFAANVEENRAIMIKEFGGNITLLSRTQLGALWQAYSVTWLFDGNQVMPSEHYKIDFTHDLLPKLTISDIQQSHFGAYVCMVSVTNPYDGEVWRVTSRFSLSATSSNGWMYPTIIGAAVLVLVILAPVITALLCRCYRARKRVATRYEADIFASSSGNDLELISSSSHKNNSTGQKAVESEIMVEEEQAGHSAQQVSPPSSDWQWLNDQGSYSNYSNNISRMLTSAFQSEPEGSVQVEINSAQYCINFSKMVQTNQTTGHSRHVKTNLSVSVQWMYQEGITFQPYTEQQSKALETMYQQKSPYPLRINQNQYTFDFDRMCQINVSTQFTRPIKRKLSVVTCKTLADATAMQSDFETYMVHELPKNLTKEFEKKISLVAKEKGVKCTFVDELVEDQVTRLLKLEGTLLRLQAAEEAIGKVLSSPDIKTGVADNLEYPEDWEPQQKTTELFSLREGSNEWQRVSRKFSTTMAGRKINSILRIQNKLIWEKYAAHKKFIEHKNDGQVNEKELFHGTTNSDPKDIYAGEDGFDMRYSKPGMWGKANYFAVDASYSDTYAYIPNRQIPGTKQMFLAKVLTGDSYECKPNDSLKMPPTKSGSHEHTQIKYDTVTGNTKNCRVYMTYDNQKAYPAYLITYEIL